MTFNFRGEKIHISGHSENDSIVKAISNGGTFYEIDLLHYMERNIPKKTPPTVAIDIGANIGNHSIYMGKFIAQHVISIEANVAIAEQLKANLEMNKVHSSIIEQAVGSHVSTGILFTPENAENNIGMSKVVEGSETDSPTLKINTLDIIFDEWTRAQTKDYSLTAIKIDIEGMEVPALQGAQNTLRSHKPEVFVEVTDALQFKRISQVLSELDYYPIHSSARTPVLHYRYNAPLLQRWLFKLLRPLGFYSLKHRLCKFVLSRTSS